ncbi:hypothetical protein IW01_14270 [Pectobacterium brasiliense]|nr:hypothetical protein IW01_14270 [Pectobacterium brasiliense]
MAGSANQLRNGSLPTELEEKLATRRSLSVEDVEDIEAKVAKNRQRNLNNPQSVSPSATTSAAGALAGSANQLRNGSLPTELEEKLATRRSLSVEDVEDIEAKLAKNRQRNLNNPQSVSPSATTSAAGALAGSANQLRNGSLPTELEEKLATRRSLSVEDVEDIEAKVAKNRQRNLNNPQSVSPSATTSAAGALAGSANQLRNGSLPTELEEKLATRRSLSVEDVEDIEASFVKSKNRHMQGARRKANLQRKIENRNFSNVVASRRATEQMPVNGSSAQFFQRNSPLQKSASLSELRSSRREDDFVYTTQRQPDFFRFRNSSDNVAHFIPTASNSGRNSDRLSAIDKPQQKETLQESRDGFLDVHNDTNESLA